jgi:hypothetical protein
LCDGANGTPDLRDRFVAGAGPADSPGSSGDSAHTHALEGFHATTRTNQGGAHSHFLPRYWYNRTFGNAWYAPNRTAIDTGGSFTYVRVQDAGVHDHGLSRRLRDRDDRPDQRPRVPKSYAACWIMELYPASPDAL